MNKQFIVNIVTLLLGNYTIGNLSKFRLYLFALNLRNHREKRFAKAVIHTALVNNASIIFDNWVVDSYLFKDRNILIMNIEQYQTIKRMIEVTNNAFNYQSPFTLA